MNAKIALILPLMLLAACESQPPQTLDQKLAEATTPSDRKETLRLACLNEAEWPASLHKMRTSGRRAAYERMRAKETPEIRELKALCRQMDDLTTEDAEEKLSPKELSNKCAAIVSEKTKQTRTGGANHATRVELICKKMINVK